jgi:hypothetical protein
MVGKLFLAGALALTLGASVFAQDATSSVDVAVKGIMQEDKGGMFILADGNYYDLVFSDEANADMKKFYGGLEGDMVRVKGSLVVEKDKEGKMRLLVLATEVARLKGERAPEVKHEPRVIQERPVYVERERARGIRLPGVRINW